jgi:hypothetical protein
MAYRILAVEKGFSILLFGLFTSLTSRVNGSGFRGRALKAVLTAILIALFFVASGIGEAAMTLSLRSPAFSHLGEIPRRYTCEGSVPVLKGHDPVLSDGDEMEGRLYGRDALLMEAADVDARGSRPGWRRWFRSSLE